MSFDEDDEDGGWTPYADLHLVNSIAGLRAVGINHNFCMAIVAHRFGAAMQTKVDVEKLRKRLKTLYDFEAAERLSGEVLFPNEIKPFHLPPSYRERIEAKKASLEASSKPKRSVGAPKAAAPTPKVTTTPKVTPSSAKVTSATPKVSSTTPKVTPGKNTKTPKRAESKEDKKTPASQNKLRKARASEKNDTPVGKRRRNN